MKNMREFGWLLKAARDKKWQEEDELLWNVVSLAADDFIPSCFLYHEKYYNWDDAELIQIGFDSLVRVAIQSKTDFTIYSYERGQCKCKDAG